MSFLTNINKVPILKNNYGYIFAIKIYMTIKDIAIKICDKYSLTIDLSIPIEDAIKQSQRWIPIDEKFPPRNVKILFKNNNDRIEYGWFDFTYTDLVNHYKYWRLFELT